MPEQLIEIMQDRPGFNGFIGSWFCQGRVNLLVDVGTARSAGRLVDALTSSGCRRLDYILLTHIHLDHAGGLAPLLRRFPTARVVCHEKAVPHLCEPSRLYTGSLANLGDVAEMYGPPEAVKREQLIPHGECTLQGLTVVETPGHAPHHLSFIYGNRLFVGEAAGNYFVFGGVEYLRPATPPRFFFYAHKGSAKRLLSFDDMPICYSHFGRAESSHRYLRMSLVQLGRWEEIIHDIASKGHDDTDLVAEQCMAALLERDPYLQGFHLMDAPSQARERMLMTNSVKGFLGFFRENPHHLPKGRAAAEDHLPGSTDRPLRSGP